MLQSVWLYIWVFVGGGIGSALRYGVSRASFALIGPSFPAGTLFVNIVGWLFMGLVAGWFAYRDVGIDQSTKLFLTTGILGGFTTFSAFALDTAVLWQRGEMLTAGLYVSASVIVSIASLFAGLAIMRMVFA